MTLRFQIQPTQNAQWSWWLYAANNEMVAWAGETFVSSTHAQPAATDFKTGASRSSAHTDTQAQAISRGRQIIGNAGGGELNIHGVDGQLRAKDTIAPGDDPRSTRG